MVSLETSDLLVLTYKHLIFAFAILAIFTTFFSAFLSFGLKRVVKPIVCIGLKTASVGTLNNGTSISDNTFPVLVPEKNADQLEAPSVPITT